MSAFVKLQRKGQMVIPRSLRQEAGVVEGSLLKVDVLKSGQFLVTAQVTIDRPLITHARKDRKQILRELAAAVDELRDDAKDKGIDRMSMAEINRAVAAARRDLRKRGNRPAK
jgi:bifunctional DNA-binding transcriptional regulator/antitoxin component of YhaV-PrlF toxin-antitoxin module